MNKRIRKKKGRLKIIYNGRGGTTKERYYNGRRDGLKVGQIFTVAPIVSVEPITKG